MFKIKTFLNNCLFPNINKKIFLNNKNFGFSHFFNSTLLINNNFLPFHSIDNTDIFSVKREIENIDKNIENSIVEKIEFKNKTRKVAERKRKKRKTGKKISLRWR